MSEITIQDLSGVSEMLLIPFYIRAMESQRHFRAAARVHRADCTIALSRCRDRRLADGMDLRRAACRYRSHKSLPDDPPESGTIQ